MRKSRQNRREKNGLDFSLWIRPKKLDQDQTIVQPACRERDLQLKKTQPVKTVGNEPTQSQTKNHTIITINELNRRFVSVSLRQGKESRFVELPIRNIMRQTEKDVESLVELHSTPTSSNRM